MMDLLSLAKKLVVGGVGYWLFDKAADYVHDAAPQVPPELLEGGKIVGTVIVAEKYS